MPPNSSASSSGSEIQELTMVTDDNANLVPSIRHRQVPSNTIMKVLDVNKTLANMDVQTMRHMIHNAWNVCHFNALPQWLQDNDYLHSGHRPELASFTACFWSIFRLHTETLNIWTHGVGCIVFVFLAVYLFVCTQYASVPLVDQMMLGIFLATAIMCLGFSTCYHTLSCHSHRVCMFFTKLDYCGISLLIAGSIVPCLYYGFYCSFYTQVFYTCLTVVLCAASLIVSFWDKFSDVHYRAVRASVFTAYAFSSFIPAIHWYMSDEDLSHLKGSLQASFQSSIYFLFLMATFYIMGVIIYALRIPERFYPGKFDFYFHSHQLFHIFVFVAAICHLRGITCMADFRLFANQATCED